MPRQITSPFQVLCEGDGDEGFLNALKTARGLPNFDVTCVAEEDGAFEAKLKAFEVAVDRGEVRRVLVVADNDIDPDRSFRAIQRAIERCKFYPVPAKPLQIRTSGTVVAAVAMLPGTGETGNLETLLLRSVERTAPDIVRCAEAFSTCSLNGHDDPWTRGQRDKMLLRSAISARIKKDPNCSLSYVWSKEGCPMNPMDDAFKWLADFVLDFFR